MYVPADKVTPAFADVYDVASPNKDGPVHLHRLQWVPITRVRKRRKSDGSALDARPVPYAHADETVWASHGEKLYCW